MFYRVHSDPYIYAVFSRVLSDPCIYAVLSRVLFDTSIYALFLLFRSAYYFLSTSCHINFKLTVFTLPHLPILSCCLRVFHCHFYTLSTNIIYGHLFCYYFLYSIFYFTGSTNSLPNGQTVPCFILGCTTCFRSIIGTVCYMWCPYGLHSPLPQHSMFAAGRASYAFASPAVSGLAVACFSRSLLPLLSVSSDPFSRSYLSLSVASPAVASPTIACL